MIKKIVMSLLGVGVVAGLLLGSNMRSYVTTSCERVAQSVEGSVPTEFQIDRARKMVRDLEPEIRRSMHVIAKEEVEVETARQADRSLREKGSEIKVGNHASAV